jgi:2-dehydropantoate 2-reductase
MAPPSGLGLEAASGVLTQRASHAVVAWQSAGVRVVVFGAGAIGGVVGARLFQSGVDVTLVARGAHAEALADGLVLEAPGEVVTLPIPVVTKAAAVRWTDDTVVLLAVKGQHTEDALTQLVASAPRQTPIVCMQNGVENERRVLRRFPRTFAMCVMCPASHLRPGHVVAHSAPITGLLDLGCYPSGQDDVARDLADTLDATTFQSVARPDIMRWKYRKLIMNLANAVEALSGRDGRGGTVARAAQKEGETVLRAAGIAVASVEEDRERRGDLVQIGTTTSVPRSGGSSWQSLARGAGSIEAEFLNGEIVLLGALHGVATPVNAALQMLAVQAAAVGRGAGTFDLDEVTAAAGLGGDTSDS